MSTSVLVAEERPSSWVAKISAFVELTKPRIALLVLVTVAAAAWVATWGQPTPSLVLHTLLGTLLIACSACAGNQCMEISRDRLMQRTARRPLVQGRLALWEAVVFTSTSLMLGVTWMICFVNLQTALIGIATWGLYVLVYTPLKTLTSWNTAVGAIPGALPVLIGWTCVGGQYDLRAAALFCLVFLWQFPHFMAIAWLYRHQYERAGFKMLPNVDHSGRWAGIQAVACASALLPVSLLPSLAAPGFGSFAYAVVATLLGIGQLICAIQFARTPQDDAARRLLWASLIYLPLVLLSLVVLPVL